VATTKDKLIAGAQKLVEKGQFEKAIKEYLKVVQADDKDVRIWLKIGDLYAKLGKKQEAAETYQKVAEFYSDQGFYLKAVAVYKQILKIEPRLVEVNQRLADLYKQLGLLSDAMQQYEAVAAFYHREGKTREALASLKQIVELDPETVANRIKLAELYSKESMAREAIDEFTKAAEQLKEQGRTDDYLKVAERLLFHSPDNRPVSKELARAYIEKGDPRRALPKLQICFKADPRDVEVLGLLAKAFEALDQRAKSVSVLKELARILGENGDRAARDEVHRKILQLAPNDPDAEAALGQAPRSRPKSQSNVQAVKEPQQPLGASWPPPAPMEEPPSSEFDDSKPTALPDSDELRDAVKTGGGPIPTAHSLPAIQQPSDEEAIGRILNETDVYIKYKLYAKAIEHVQRVFEHDAKHIEAREKLKALYLTVGKRDEAILELWSLAEQAEPGRQRRYLREILELEPSNQRAASMLGETAAPAGAQPAKRESLDDRDEVDVDDLEELPDEEFEVADPSQKIDLRPMRGGDSDEVEVASDDDDLIPLVVDPLADKHAAEAAGEAGVEDRFGLDEPQEEDRFGLPDEGGAEVASRFDTAAPSEAHEVAPAAPTDSEAHAVAAGVEFVTERKPKRPVMHEETSEPDVRTRFDPNAARMLMQDALFGGNQEVDESELPEAPPPVSGTATLPAASLPKHLREGTPVTRMPPEPPKTIESKPESSLEDDLDEADFFVQQSLFDEARGILEALLSRHPGHPLVSAKLRDLNALEQQASGAVAPANEEPEVVAQNEAEMSAEMPADLPGTTEAGAHEAEALADEPVYELTRKGVIEKGVNAEDFETHYDLGIAYKEMGLVDDAIAEFKLVMRDPSREVQCHLMIGLCCLEKGQITEAIGQFKKGLYVEGITERESLSLYFELGQAYERLGDPREALYYYEKVMKRDPRFRQVEQRVESLRSGSQAEQAPAAPAKPAPTHDDVDDAFDTLLGSSES
jgi:tetratricopeptide (TPR) repeat protein